MSLSLNELTDEARALKGQGRHVEALEVLGAMVEQAPNNVAVLHNYAAVLGEAGRNKEAVEIMRKAFSIGLNAPESWLVFGRVLAGNRDLEEAEAALMHLVRMQPTDHEAHRELAQLIWMKTGDRDKALVVLNAAIEANPGASNLHIARAQVYGQTGSHDTEYAIVKEAARLSNGDPMMEWSVCSAALAAKHYDAALEYGRRAATAAPNENGVVSSYCMALLGVGDAEGAAQVAETLRQRAPLNQLFIALQATAWRLLKDERYHQLFDYDAFVMRSELTTPKGWKSLEKYLDDLIEGLDQAHSFKTHPFSQSVKHGSQISSINGSDIPALRAYIEAVSGPVQRYVDKLGPGDDPVRSRNIGGFRIFSTWSISLPPKGFHINHVHPEGWISSACHLRLAKEDPGNEKGGWLKFGEPGVATLPVLEPEMFVKPEAGVMAVFPSYMWHGTVSFESTGAPRLTAPVDIVPAAPA
ncbi:MAG: tetratricopeptide repeat protein [Marinicaulis sp.]|nr:tetratricopeptide repeat protein [Marinicaulis sp.]